MTDFDVVATGLKFPEGPIAMPDGTVVVVEIAAGRLSRVRPDGSVAAIAELGGGPNGAAIGARWILLCLQQWWVHVGRAGRDVVSRRDA